MTRTTYRCCTQLYTLNAVVFSNFTQEIITSIEFSYEFLYAFGPNHDRKVETEMFSAAWFNNRFVSQVVRPYFHCFCFCFFPSTFYLWYPPSVQGDTHTLWLLSDRLQFCCDVVNWRRMFIFFSLTLGCKFVPKSSLKIPPRAATLPCEVFGTFLLHSVCYNRLRFHMHCRFVVITLWIHVTRDGLVCVEKGDTFSERSYVVLFTISKQCLLCIWLWMSTLYWCQCSELGPWWVISSQVTSLCQSADESYSRLQCTKWRHSRFWATVCKTVRPMLSDRCPVCSSVEDVGVLWPNGWMDQDATWYGGRPWPRPHCVRWGPSPPPQKKERHSPQFSAHVYCVKTVAHLSYCWALVYSSWQRWIKDFITFITAWCYFHNCSPTN